MLIVCAALPALARADDEQEPAKKKHQPKPLNVFEGRVLDHEQNPVADALVHAVRSDNGYLSCSGPDRVYSFARDQKFFFFFPKRNGRGSGETRTDDQGRFVIQGLRTGKIHVLAIHPERGIAVATNVEQPNAGKGLDVTLAPPTFVEGQIKGLGTNKGLMWGTLLAKGSMPWWSFSPDNLSSTSINVSPDVDLKFDGSFRVGPLPIGGEWTLNMNQIVIKRSFSVPILQFPVSVEAGKTARLDVDLTASPKVTGRIIGPKGKPLADAGVTLSDPSFPDESDHQPYAMYGGGKRYGAVTDKDGNYTIIGAPKGKYRLKAWRHAVRTGMG
jgi:protocatechuate 3,4-dioxygenase beta subunit